MSSKTYKTRALVLKKTKLREKDLIVTMLDDSGAIVKGVAKGARKPGGSLAARLELCSTVDVLMACGHSLDVVTEARLAKGTSTPSGLERSLCAAPIAELLCLVAQPDLEQPRLYDLASASIARIATAPEGDGRVLVMCAASLWKIVSQSGFRPSLTSCVICGRDIPFGQVGAVGLSIVEGGAVCDSCPRPADAVVANAGILQWCETLIMSRFDDIAGFEIDRATAFDALQLARSWIHAHTGRNLKSLDFLFASGVF